MKIIIVTEQIGARSVVDVCYKLIDAGVTIKIGIPNTGVIRGEYDGDLNALKLMKIEGVKSIEEEELARPSSDSES